MLLKLLWDVSKTAVCLLILYLLAYTSVTFFYFSNMSSAFRLISGHTISVSTALLLFVPSLCLFIINWWYDHKFVDLAQLAITNLQVNLCKQVIIQSSEKIEAIEPSQLKGALSADITSIQNAYQVLPASIYHLFLMIMMLSILLYMSWFLTLTIFLVICICSLLYLLMAKLGTQHLKNARKQKDDLEMLYEGVILGNKELKHNMRRAKVFIENKISQVSLRNAKTSKRAILSFAHGNNAIRVMLNAIIILILCVQSTLLVNHTLMITYFIILTFFTRSIYPLLSTLRQLIQASVAMQHLKKLNFILSGRKQNLDTIPDVALKSYFHQISLKKVCYVYRNSLSKSNTFQCGPIDLTFASGSITFIAGKNGSGKSSLIKLISGIYQPVSGSVVLNNNTLITSENISEYQQYFSCIYENDYLFEEIMGHKNITTETINYYINKLELAGKVEIVGNRLSTLKLSKGQKKRLALLAAYLDDKPVYIFDEWAADQDPKFREMFYTTFLEELKQKNKLIIVVSHDEQYFYVADQVVFISNGKVSNVSTNTYHAAHEKYS